MNESRIFVTGLGLCTPVGRTREDTWDSLLRGKRGIRPISFFDTTGQKGSLAGMVEDLVLPPHRREQGVVWSRSSALAEVAAREAIAHAGLDVASTRVGLVVGGTTGGMFETESHLAALHANPELNDSILELLTHPLSATGDSLHAVLGPFTRVRTLSTACSSGANALILGAIWILSGFADVVVAGGSDGLCRLTLSGFNALSAIDPELCRPFDRARRGLNLGEGAGFVVLERADHAKKRNARVLAELSGWAFGSEAHHITNPESSGRTARRIMEAALAEAGLSSADIDYVNAHGTGTPLNDPMETTALHAALGAEVERIPVSSTKGHMGHTLAAAGAIEAAISVLALQHQAFPPTVGLVDPDPECKLHHVFEKGKKGRVRSVLSNSFGFGGMDSTLVLSEPELGPPRKYKRRSVVVTGAATLTAAGVEGLKDAKASTLAREPGRRITMDLAPKLDLARARRLDRPARVQAVIVEQALADAALAPQGKQVGYVMGSGYGSLDASAAFMHRVFDKGPRLASPADFPNLVPSSPVGHVTIYLGSEGPALAACDLKTSGEAACVMAVELVEAGIASAMLGGAFEEESRIVERRLDVIHSKSGAPRRHRAEGAGVVVFESEEAVRARGARILGHVTDVVPFRENAEAALAAFPAPRDPGAAVVILPRRDPRASALLANSAWKSVRVLDCNGAGGDHEALGAIALAAAASILATGEAKETLVLSTTPERGGYLFRFVAP